MSLTAAGAAVIGSGLNFISNAMNNQRQENLTDEERAWREKMAQQANKWSIQQWNRENAYNDPSAQMERLAEAGINPALAYASGVFNQAATSPSVNAPDGLANPKTMPYQLDPMMMANLELVKAQTESIEHATEREDEKQPYSIDKLKADTDVARQRVSNLSAEEQKTLSDMSLDWLRYSIDYDKAYTQIDLWNSQKGLNDELKIKTKTEYEQMVALYALREENLRLTNSEIAAQLKIDEKELAVMDKRIELMTSQEYAAYGQGASSFADAALVEFREGVMREQAGLYKAQGDYYNDYRQHTAKYNTHFHFGGSVSLNPNETFKLFKNSGEKGEEIFNPDGTFKKGYARRGDTIYKTSGKVWKAIGKVRQIRMLKA